MWPSHLKMWNTTGSWSPQTPRVQVASHAAEIFHEDGTPRKGVLARDWWDVTSNGSNGVESGRAHRTPTSGIFCGYMWDKVRSEVSGSRFRFKNERVADWKTILGIKPSHFGSTVWKVCPERQDYGTDHTMALVKPFCLLCYQTGWCALNCKTKTIYTMFEHHESDLRWLTHAENASVPCPQHSQQHPKAFQKLLATSQKACR